MQIRPQNKKKRNSAFFFYFIHLFVFGLAHLEIM